MAKRIKTDYPGVYYRWVHRVGRKDKEKVYYIVFKKEGRVIEEKVGRQFVDDMTPARAARIRSERIEGRRKSRKQLKLEAEDRREAEAGRWTIDRLWREYLTYRPGSSNNVIDKNRYALHVKPYFGNKEPAELVPLDFDRLRRNLLKAKSPQTVKHVLALIVRIINFGSNKGLCDRLGFKVEMPRVNNLKTEDLTPDQLSRLMTVPDQSSNLQVANLMKLALFTGMRRGELLKLKWEDLDFERGFIAIKGPKGGRDQNIPMNDPTREILRNHPRTDSPLVFPGQDGNQRTGVGPQVNQIKKAAGLPKDFRPLHGLRHSYASMLASSGQVDLYTLQKLLTHKHPAMTQRYAHLRDEALKRAAEVAGEIVRGVVKRSDQEEAAE